MLITQSLLHKMDRDVARIKAEHGRWGLMIAELHESYRSAIISNRRSQLELRVNESDYLRWEEAEYERIKNIDDMLWNPLIDTAKRPELYRGSIPIVYDQPETKFATRVGTFQISVYAH